MKKPSIFCLLTTLGFLGVSSLGSADIQFANLITVNTNLDSGIVIGCNLRKAIDLSNNTSSSNECGTYDSNKPTKIVFSSSVTSIILSSSLPPITSSLSIYGPGVTIQGDDTFQLLNINAPSKTVTVDGLTMTKGKAGNGGAVQLVAGTLNLSNASLHDNTASVFGGAVFSSGVLNITHSTIGPNNTAPLGGGVASLNAGSKLVISDSTVYQNKSSDQGAGIYLSNSAQSSVTNSTISGNVADNAGGGIVAVDSVLDLRSVTIANNVADFIPDPNPALGGGIKVSGSSTVTVKNSIVANNFTGPGIVISNCYGMLASSQGYNLSNSSDCSFTAGTDKQNVNASLAALADNGGSTLTHALNADSEAIDVGDPAGCKDENGVALVGDQRGFARISDGNGDGTAYCDIGAYEFGSVVLPPAVCSNSVQESGEACDDGNSVSGDGCAADCSGTETGFNCVAVSGSLTACTPVCGDGVIVGTEQCDDSNTGDADGCSASCQVESGFTCTGTPSVCTSVTPAPAGGGGGGGCSISSVSQAAGQWPVVAIALASVSSALFFRRRVK